MCEITSDMERLDGHRQSFQGSSVNETRGSCVQKTFTWIQEKIHWVLPNHNRTGKSPELEKAGGLESMHACVLSLGCACPIFTLP